MIKIEDDMSAGTNQVLIIDDDIRNTFALNAVLRAKGFDCVTAQSAQEGIAHLTRPNRIGVVLLDMMMPEMDGYETIQVIRKDISASIPMISVTAQAMQGDKEKCLKAGADAYIAKPVDLDQLVLLLHRYLR
jgi:CheY-like chemotaxis protein